MRPSNPSVAEDLELALLMADEASAIALDRFRRGVSSRQKADGSAVTDADLEVEHMLTAALATERPGDAVLGEEFGGTPGAARRWIIDPIDGTRNFIAGRTDWGVHIALEANGEIVVGVVTRPVLAMRWWAGRACGALVGTAIDPGEPAPLHVSSQASLATARVSGWLVDGDPRKDRLRSLPGWVEPLDLDSIMQVAEGRLDALVDGTASEIWDRAPLVVLVEEAGGRYQDLTGGRNLNLPGGLFTNSRIDDELSEFLMA